MGLRQQVMRLKERTIHARGNTESDHRTLPKTGGEDTPQTHCAKKQGPKHVIKDLEMGTQCKRRRRANLAMNLLRAPPAPLALPSQTCVSVPSGNTAVIGRRPPVAPVTEVHSSRGRGI